MSHQKRSEVIRTLAGLKKKTTCMSAFTVSMRATYMSCQSIFIGLQPVLPKDTQQAIALGAMQGCHLLPGMLWML